MTRRPALSRILTLLLACSVPYPSLVAASDHWGILTDLTDSLRETAFVEVSGLAQCAVTVGVLGQPGGNVSMILDPDEVFASSLSSTMPNLFKASDGKAALFRVTTTVPVDTQVLLRQRSGTAKIILTVPPADRTLGRSFAVPIGDLGQGTNLFLGNPSGIDIQIDVTQGSGLAERITVPAGGVAKYALKVPNSRVTAAGVGGELSRPFFLAVLTIDIGRVEETILLPL